MLLLYGIFVIIIYLLENFSKGLSLLWKWNSQFKLNSKNVQFED